MLNEDNEIMPEGELNDCCVEYKEVCEPLEEGSEREVRTCECGETFEVVY